MQSTEQSLSPQRFQQLPAHTRPEARAAMAAVWDALAVPGPCWSSTQRIAIASISRSAQPRPPWFESADLGQLANVEPDAAGLTAYVAEVVERVAVAANKLDRSIVQSIIETIGEHHYAELCAVVSQVVPIDHFCTVMGVDLEPLPRPGPGEPTGERATDVADVGSYLRSEVPWGGPNVGRAFSLARADDRLRLRLVRALYSGDEFDQMVWTSRHLSRPQVELLASRTSALNECFY